MPVCAALPSSTASSATLQEEEQGMQRAEESCCMLTAREGQADMAAAMLFLGTEPPSREGAVAAVDQSLSCALLCTCPCSQVETGGTGRDIERPFSDSSPGKLGSAAGQELHTGLHEGIIWAPCKKEAVEHMFLDRKYKNKMKILKRLLSEAMSCICRFREAAWLNPSGGTKA